MHPHFLIPRWVGVSPKITLGSYVKPCPLLIFSFFSFNWVLLRPTFSKFMNAGKLTITLFLPIFGLIFMCESEVKGLRFKRVLCPQNCGGPPV